MLAALKRNEKGLTLIELLAVLVIIGIIAAIAIPAIGNTINSAKTKADQATMDMVQDAAQRYFMDRVVNGNTDSNFTYDDATEIGTFITTLETDGYLAALRDTEEAKIGSIVGTIKNGVMSVAVTKK